MLENSGWIRTQHAKQRRGLFQFIERVFERHLFGMPDDVDSDVRSALQAVIVSRCSVAASR